MRPESSRSASLVLLAGLVAAWVIAACAPVPSPTSTTQPAAGTAKPAGATPTAKPAAGAKLPSCDAPVKIGMLLSQTGNTALIGKLEKEASMLLIDQVNSSGGINGCQIEVIAYDPESDPEKGATLTKRLIEQDKVVAILGPETGWVHGATASIVVQAKVPSFTGNGGLFSLRPELQEWNFSSTSNPQIQTTASWPYMKSLGIKKWAMLATPDPMGNAMVDIGKEIGQSLSMEMVGDERQPITDKDLTPALSKLKAKGPEGLFINGSGEWGVIAINNAAQVGFNIPVVYSGAYSWDAFQKGLTPEATKNLQLLTGKLDAFSQLRPDDPARPTIMKFVEDFRAKYRTDPQFFSGVGYDAALTLVTALRTAGPDRQKIKEAAENLKNLQGVTGSLFSFSPKNHMGIRMEDGIAVKLEGNDKKIVGYMSDIMKKLTTDDLKAIDKLRAEKPTIY